ncbi:DsbA family protein [Tropicimonas sp. IMCC34043]|uniref:DsbA family protein n=1 Tax=Tropicimonas sp. IMCC34043 TaxID=2248760 RepID=UPI000E234CD1|nr:DsbA family protein [Tropicimonas sp. IMCC34043]
MTTTQTLSALVLAAVAGLGPWTLPAAPALSSLIGAGAAQAQDAVAIEDMVLGKADAPVEVIEYASFTCGHCARFNQEVFPQIRKNYIDTGKVKFIQREVYFDRYGLWASMVARCGGEMRFYGIADMLFAEINDWTEGEPAQIGDNLRKIGRKAGLSDEQVNACLQDAAQAQALVDWYEGNSKADGIDATPTFIIDGKKYSNMSYEDFAKTLDEELAKK